MENNKYLLTMIIAKRAKELRKGAKPLVTTKSRLPMKIALEEVKAGKVYLKEKEQPLKAEDVFLGEEGSQKVEEPAKVEDISNEVKEPEKSEDLL
ncbi:DNA-directed RNA polymerase subunit omega [bacterium]|nr:DNA-directed RNA polymerase subunit omega [bacterium]MBU4563051.1 DNA-directed RNA polymerase subunit omega [bacterium]